MSKEKQIEEMTKFILGLDTYTCEECDKCGKWRYEDRCDDTCFSKKVAESLYNAGYRKQSENTVEVVRCKDCEYWTEVSFDAITEWHWGECRKPLGDYRDCDTAEHDFCSYGEAKMKGGAE